MTSLHKPPTAPEEQHLVDNHSTLLNNSEDASRTSENSSDVAVRKGDSVTIGDFSYQLVVRQQPNRARAIGFGEKDR